MFVVAIRGRVLAETAGIRPLFAVLRMLDIPELDLSVSGAIKGSQFRRNSGAPRGSGAAMRDTTAAAAES
jgi:hypothetical protein